MKKQIHKIIGVDLDDVLLNFNDAFVAFNNSKYGTSYTRASLTSFNVEDAWGISFEEAHKRIHEFQHSQEHKNAEPIAGAIKAITALAQDNTIHVVTASPADLRDEIEIWLGKHFPDIIQEIHFTRKDLFDKNPKKKADICKELGVEVFVEDSLQNAESIASIGIPVFLIDAPWNQGNTLALVTRVYSWDHILEQFV